MTNEPKITDADWVIADRALDNSHTTKDLRTDLAYAAMLGRTRWTPPVDPDLAEAQKPADDYADINDCWISTGWLLRAIKRGRELAAAEAAPGLVWKKHDGGPCPVDPSALVVVKHARSIGTTLFVGIGAFRGWDLITHYAEITPPEEVA